MKRMIFILLFIGLTITTLYSQSVLEIEVGDGTTNTSNFPCNGNYDYSWTNYIIPAEQFRNSIAIDEILFEVANEPSNYTMNNQQLYLGYTNDDVVSMNLPDLNNYPFLLVFEGSITWNGSGWQGITLDEEFYLTCRSNLQLVWINGDGTGENGYPEFKKTDTLINSATFSCSNGSTPDNFDSYASCFPNMKLKNTVPGLIDFLPANFGMGESLTPTLSIQVDDRYRSFTILFNDIPDPFLSLVIDVPVENDSFSYTFPDPLKPYTDYYWTVLLIDHDNQGIAINLAFKTDHQMDGLGTEDDPYLVDSITNLEAIGCDNIFNNKHYLQVANIDASVTSDFNFGAGFLPIGFKDGSPFTGSYNGQGFTISNLYIDRPEMSFIALFGKVDNADISNVGLVDVDITGHSYVSGLIGYANSSEISNSYATGIVEGASSSVGGLVGYSENGTISKSYSRALVSSFNNRVGGLIGYVYNGVISNCFASGDVNGAGGLVGKAYNSSISYCYSVGNVNGNTSGIDIGGLVGSIEGEETTIHSSFWDMEASGQSTSAGGIGKTSLEMTYLDTYLSTGWDFVNEVAHGTEDIWMLDPDINSGHPFIYGLGYIAPEIINYIPLETDFNIAIDEIINFSVIAEEVNRNLTYMWFVDEVQQENSSNMFSYQFSDLFAHQVKVVVSNDDYRTNQVWNINGVVSNDGNLVTSLITGIDFNYPNPFNPETTIKYTLSKDSQVRITIYDLRGRFVRNLRSGFEKAGVHSVSWNGLNRNGKRVASGSYFIRMETSEGSDVRKITLMK